MHNFSLAVFFGGEGSRSGATNSATESYNNVKLKCWYCHEKGVSTLLLSWSCCVMQHMDICVYKIF